MKKTAFFFFLALVSIGAIHAQEVLVRNATPVDYNTLAYPNSMGNTTSTGSYKGKVIRNDGSVVEGKVTLFKKKGVFERVKLNTPDGKVEIEAAQIQTIALDPIIFEKKYPNNFKNIEKNFQPGYIVLTGERIPGKVAQVKDFSDYDFFVYTIIFLPDGSDVASMFRAGQLTEFGQEINGKMNVWDGYADGYLVREIDGLYRLSRNPYSTARNEFFSSIKAQMTDSLAKEAARKALVKSLQDGKNVNESMENAASTASVVGEVLGSVQINKKEYLIFDTRRNTVIVVNRNNLQQQTQPLASACGSTIGTASWDSLGDFITRLNTACK